MSAILEAFRDTARKSPFRFAISIALLVLASGGSVLIALGQRWLADRIGAGFLESAAGVVLLTFGWIALVLVNRVEGSLRDLTSRSLAIDYRERVLTATGDPNAPLELLEGETYKALVSDAQRRIDDLSGLAWTSLSLALRSVGLLSALLLLWTVSPILALAGACAVLGFAMSQVGLKHVERIRAQQRVTRYREEALHADLTDPRQLGEFKLWANVSALQTRATELRAKADSTERRAELIALGLGFLGTISFAMIFGAAVSAPPATGTWEPGSAALVVSIASQLVLQYAYILNSLGAFNQGLAARSVVGQASAPLVREVQQGPRLLEDSRVRVRLGVDALVLHGVGFRYPAAKRDAVTGVTVRLPRGSTIVITGPNGSGKTTLVRLLLGQYEPTQGWIEGGGDPKASALLQPFGKIPLPPLESIALGDADLPIDEGRLRRSVNLTGLNEELLIQRAKPEDVSGYSHGEWQKIALARALYRRDVGILALDEPTSALDEAGRERLISLLKDRTGSGETWFIVSHEPSVIDATDYVLKMRDGRLTYFGRREGC